MGRRALLVVVVALAGCGLHPRVEDVAALQGDEDHGFLVYDANCVRCHGDDGEGRAGPKLATEAIATRDAELLAHQILAGRNLMPGFADELDDQEVADLIAYLRTLAP